MSSWIQSLDAQIASALSSWNLYTTLIVLVITALVAYPIVFPAEPDTHPLLLARQSVPSPVRNKGQSAAYRASDTPHGYPLRTGLNVKDPAAPRWASGKDGDLRDVWRETAKAGGVAQDGKQIPRGLIMTILGREETIEREIEDLTKEIIVLGKHMKGFGVKKVAIYLPNNIEYLLAVFACSFYGVSPILLPFNLPHVKLFDLLKTTGADGLICAAGSIPLQDVADTCTALRLLTWVVESTSRHMDWNGVPESASDRLRVSVWHDIINDQASGAPENLPNNDNLAAPPEVITIYQPSSPADPAEIVAFSHASLVAAIAALLVALPLRHRLTSADLVLPTDSFCNTYVLCYTFAAMFAHSGLAVNSVAGSDVDLAIASYAVKPTVIIASAGTLAAMHAKESAGITGGLQRLGMAVQAQALAAGRMPTDTVLSRVLLPRDSRSTPSRLRLILASERIAGGTPPLTAAALADLRIFTKARIAYALTCAGVAGAVAQSNVLDYRRDPGPGCAPFGGPVGSVELKLLSDDEVDVAGTAQGVVGQLVVSGPAVAGGTVRTGARCRIRADGTVAYA